MDFRALLTELSTTDFSTWMQAYGYRIAETIHVIGVVLVFGTIAVVDLRLLGIPSTRRSFRELAGDLLPWTWIAFATAATTGILMFVGQPVILFDNPFFRVKLILLVLAGLNMLMFELVVARTMARWDKDARPPLAARIPAILSLCLWIGIVFLGRWIGFYEPPVAITDQSVFDDFF